ncbi:MAG: 50S ribosomal protein L22 [archaeon]
MNRYSYQGNDERVARACSKDLNVSWKHCNEVCYAIRGKSVNAAEKYLNEVLERRAFIPMRRYNKGVPHRRGGKPGRYLDKSVKIVLKLLQNVKANAEHKGLDGDKLKIIHSTSYKASTIPRIKPKGRSKRHCIDLANLEIAVKEMK